MKLFLGKLQSMLRIDVLVDFLNNRSVREKFLILGFGGIILLSLDYFLWLSPVMKTLSRTIPAYMAAETDRELSGSVSGGERGIQIISAYHDRHNAVSKIGG